VIGSVYEKMSHMRIVSIDMWPVGIRQNTALVYTPRLSFIFLSIDILARTQEKKDRYRSSLLVYT